MFMSMQCPYCHSRDTVQIESPQQLPSTSANNSITNNLMSPAALATLGVSVSKSLNIPPIAGAIAGVLIGGIWMLISDETPVPLQSSVYIRHYFCNDCDRTFSPSLRN